MYSLLFTILSFTRVLSTEADRSCISKFICPPFNTTTPPPYPFSAVNGCGHPSFHLTCKSNVSLIAVNLNSFSLLHYDPATSSLTLSPHPEQKNSFPFCPSNFPNIPILPLDFTNTPFKISGSSCSRVSLLKPCPTRTNRTQAATNLSSCSWYVALERRPFRILEKVCETGELNPGLSEQGCQSDVLGYLDNLLKMGISVEFDTNNDEYFSLCTHCRLTKSGICGFNSSDPKKPFLCIVDDSGVGSETSIWIRHHKERVKVAMIILVLICVVFMLVLAYYIVIQRKLIRVKTGLEDPTTTFLHRHRCASLLPPVFTYEELESSTNRFDPKRKIGDGGFGSVYLGKLFDGRVVAVKYLHRNHQTPVVGGITVSSKSFCNEILILSSIDHPNLVKLHGYCSDPRGLLLVYDYVSNGTVADHLHGPKRKVYGPLSWQTRVDIALQIAIAIEYLHFTVEPPVVHRDITTTNIFVDESLRVRVGDFGLSRLLVYSEYRNSSGELSGSSSGCIWTGPQGTPGYLDPDYHKSFRLTEKSDVYSFGVVLLELVTGLRAVDQRREKREMALADMVVAKIQLGLLDQVVDPVLVGEGGEVEESVAAVAELAFQCVANDKDDRPDAKEVVGELRRIWGRTRGVRGSNANVVVVPET
ncbi:hypothetical protein RND81_11G028100 [Saponaria officinalis]